MAPQIYEEYWSITNAFTDYNGQSFIDTLRISVDFIESNRDEDYTEEKYGRLQEEVHLHLGIGHISVRKAINQLVKLGFINPFLKSYHIDAPKYLDANTNRRRQSLLSKIVYSNSGLNKSVTTDNPDKEINFLIKTLEETGKLTKAQIAGLMLTKVSKYPRGYLTTQELREKEEMATELDFPARKYNQIDHFCNILKKLDDMVMIDNVLYFEDDARNIFGRESDALAAKKRDPYLHRIYKNQLKEESSLFFGGVHKCMVEHLAYPVLIASHIKPFILSNENEAYDVNNGILLSRNMDCLFDLGYVTFDQNGHIVSSAFLNDELRQEVAGYSLDEGFLTKERLEYLSFHREEVFEKRFRC